MTASSGTRQSCHEFLQLNHNECEGNKVETDELTKQVVECALEVHRTLGPGLLQATYEQCLAHELSSAGIPHRHRCPLPVNYKGLQFECGYQVDFLVDDSLVVELNSVDTLIRVHEAQLLTYMKLAGIHNGLLVNFNVPQLKDGLKRFVL